MSEKNINSTTDNKHLDKDNTNDIEENSIGKQTIQTEKTKLVKGEKGKKDREVLVGKKIEEIEEIEEDFNSLQNRILNKLM